MHHCLRFLAIGDSLTCGYHNNGFSFHPYSQHLSHLFSLEHIPILINQKGVAGEVVVPSMVKRAETLLLNESNPDYDWVIVLGGTNDLAQGRTSENIFNQGLKLIYDMVLQTGNKNRNLAAMTVIENGVNSPDNIDDRPRQILNEMIKSYVRNCQEQDRICLVDLDKHIPYHSIKDAKQRQATWDDMIHLTEAGYDRMANVIFQEVYSRIKK